MAKNVSTRFNLDAAADLGEDLRLALDDAFFAALEQSEILGGNVEATLLVKRRAGGGYRIAVEAKGTVRTACDRCLDEVELPIDVADEILLTDDPDAAESNPDLVLLPNTRGEYDAAWQLYEIRAHRLAHDSHPPRGPVQSRHDWAHRNRRKRPDRRLTQNSYIH